ncbi:MAG: N-6 DNA methylase [Chloroflexi bacterium]|nr:N-6 DNA methylase [Chloroflexota bacterium]
MPLATAHSEIARLVARFKGLSTAARRGYNEDNTRKDFILPLFRALEWNIQDSAEVSAEERVSRGWVDFAFRIGGVPRFFLETKRISEDLTRPQWVQQAMDYAWTKGVTWALLSDFEGLRVFNAEWKEDNPLRAQFLEFGVDSYLADFDRLWWLSRPEMVAGTLNREAEKVGKKARREPVSQHLFDDLKSWRQILFKNLHAYNPQWSAGQIDEAVLRILNRLIFIRTAEDRQVEGVRLQAMLRELRDQKRGGQLLPELRKLWREFDTAYDSQLFEMHRADLLDCPPSPLETLIEGLYGKHYLLYNFNAIDADVLGTVYEQYLGAQTALEEAEPQTAGERAAVVRRSSSVRKSQGIFYTPTFVTKYIVAQTVGRYLDEHGYHPDRPIRILDMACGSGSFLIEAFDVLDRYVAEMRGDLAPSLSPSPVARGRAGVGADVHAHARQMELLTQCIYGVDKDEQAVAVARLNLLLKALHTRDRLPPLEHIRAGDSLISGAPDELRAAFGPDWRSKRPFNWQEEFPEVFSPLPGLGEGAGGEGFDVIIGNPPYVRQETLGEEFKAYVAGKYTTHAGTADLYVYFIERAMQLLKPGGLFGFIVANKWLRANYGKPLRQWLKGQHIVEIVDFGDLPVFQTATTYPCILILHKEAPALTFRVTSVKSLDFTDLTAVVQTQSYPVAQASLDDAGWSLSADATQTILDKMRSHGISLDEYVEGRVFRGIISGLNEAFVINNGTRNRLIAQDARSVELIRPFLLGRNIKRYAPPQAERHLVFMPNGWTRGRCKQTGDEWNWLQQHYPAIADHLMPFQEAAEKRWDKGEFWWELRSCDYYGEFDKPKIIYPDIAPRGYFSIDTSGALCDSTAFIQSTASKYLLGILNSRAITFFMANSGATIRGGFLRWKRQYVRPIPVPRLDQTSPTDAARHDHLVALVDEMLALQPQLAAAERGLDDARHDLARRIARVDRAIDDLVYELYGLTEEEIRIVEGQE